MSRENNFKIFIDEMKALKYENLQYTPIQIMMGLTNVCNLRCAFCPYCGFCMKKIEKVEELSVQLLRDLKPYFNNAKFINPSGRGEPLLYKEFMQFIDIVREADGLKVMQLINNGTQLHKIDLRKLEGINVISISVDSVNKDTFELLRCGSNYEQIIENVIKLRSTLPDTVLQWTVVVNRLNMEELYDIYKLAAEIGVNYITYNSVFGYEEDNVIRLLRLRKTDYSFVTNQFEKINKENENIVINNVIAFDNYEDHEVYNRENIIKNLKILRQQTPYLDFDEINIRNTESRKIGPKKKEFLNQQGIKLPYCTTPFTTMLIQPNMSVAPCCADFGAIDNLDGGGKT